MCACTCYVLATKYTVFYCTYIFQAVTKIKDITPLLITQTVGNKLGKKIMILSYMLPLNQ